MRHGCGKLKNNGGKLEWTWGNNTQSIPIKQETPLTTLTVPDDGNVVSPVQYRQKFPLSTFFFVCEGTSVQSLTKSKIQK